MSGTVARSLGALGDALGGTANVNFDAGTLFIDGVNNRVGIATTTPSSRLTLGNNIGTQGDPNQIVLYDDGISTNRLGFGVSSGLFNIVAGGGTGIAFHTNGTNSTFERMRIDASGRITMPFQPAFHAYGGGSVSVSVSNYILALTGTITNRGSHYNTSNYRFTAPVTGMYMFAHRATWGSTGSGVAVFLAVNGSAAGGVSAATEVFGYTTGSSYHTTSACVTFIQLNVNDYVEARATVFNSSAQTLDLTRCSLSGYFVG